MTTVLILKTQHLVSKFIAAPSLLAEASTEPSGLNASAPSGESGRGECARCAEVGNKSVVGASAVGFDKQFRGFDIAVLDALAVSVIQTVGGAGEQSDGPRCRQPSTGGGHQLTVSLPETYFIAIQGISADPSLRS
ncbi:hypothetical protein [Nocardia anaemiae]|uniref:hypothetical protein n=1 Tax=Nocardia anaemiae TaxID=263910 RepID=UPI001FE175E1|nr:hypothetical protein [Nocardia anaemiae]